jgi:hypothetical protein
LQLDKIFLGITPASQRKFVTAVLKHLVDKYPNLYMPTCGTFVLTKCAIDAGYKPENIYTSDISLFSSLLGYYYSNTPVRDLNFTVGEGFEERYEACTSEIERVAYLMWVMKIKQLRPQVYYERLFYDEYMENKEHHIDKLKRILSRQDEYFNGLNYEILDLRDEITRKHEPNSLVLMDPPIYAKGYEKMFDFGDALQFESGIEEFDLKKDYRELYESSRDGDSPFLWSRYFDASDYPEEEIIYGHQKGVDRVDYWLCTRPEIVKDFAHAYYIETMKAADFSRGRWPVMTDADELTEDSRITFQPVDALTALYYRDLFAHKLGASKAEHYYLMLINGKVFATIGLLTNGLFRLQSDRFLQQFAMNAPLDGHPKANRLVAMCLTTTEFGRYLRATASKMNRAYEIKGMQTTFFSKFRKAKLNNGIMTVTKREKLKGGMYKIVYDAELRDETFKDALKKYLEEAKVGDTATAEV